MNITWKLILVAAFVATTPLRLRRSGTSTESITHITPIWEGALASHFQPDDLAMLSSRKSSLGLGGDKLGMVFLVLGPQSRYRH